ncbi:hypothetical protein LUZ60_010698 [Juncus effusus]|nr:hypothetical protein LUZ60_010698 [Juncus effusus]
MSEDEEEMNDDGMSGDEEEMEDDMDDVSNDGDVSDDVSDDVSSEEEEDDDEVNEKLRAYELNKLRYYYAVVVCDSSSTANHIYNTLDKTEFLDTSNVFDLRFIPDSMEFNKPPRDVATEVAAGYKEPDFETRALQHSKVKLTWEDDKSDRNKVLRRNFNLDQLDELNIYLASSDSSEDEKEQESKKKAAREKFLSLLKPGNEIPDSDEGESEDEREEDKAKEKEKEKGNMEVTFNTDLEALSRKISDKREKGKEETVWESVLRKKREKKQALIMSQINNDDSNSDDYNSDSNDDDDFFMEEKKGKGNDKGKKREKEKDKDNEKLALEREREASRAELELLLAEDTEKNNENKKKGYNMKKKKEKKKGKKGKKEKEEEETKEKVPEVDASEDPRFAKMFSSHLFALDPTDPQYKRSAAYLRNKSSKKGSKSGEKEATQEATQYEPTADPNERENDLKSKHKYEISAKIRSIKKNIQGVDFQRGDK